MSTTVNSRFRPFIVMDEWQARSLTYHDYEMVKLGKKHFGFRYKHGISILYSYKCSHIEARSRFKAQLIASRMLM